MLVSRYVISKTSLDLVSTRTTGCRSTIFASSRATPRRATRRATARRRSGRSPAARAPRNGPRRDGRSAVQRQGLHGFRSPRESDARTVPNARQAIPDLQRLLEDRVGPVNILQVVASRAAASRCALISGSRCDDISMPCAAAIPAAWIQPLTPPMRAASGMT